MAKPDKLPRWADTDPATNVVEPPESKKNVGWVKQEKPPARFFNWLFYKIYQWIVWLAAQVGGDDLRSNNPLTWDGTDIAFTAPIQIVFREGATVRVNQIPAADSPITIGDGEVLVVYPDKVSASPVTLTAGTYATLAAGEYAIVAESSLTDDSSEHELIIFRRRDVDSGDDEYGNGYAALEIPFTNQMIFPNSRFYLGGKNFDGQNVYDGDKSRWYSDNGATQTVEIDGEKGIITANNLPPIGFIGGWNDFGVVGLSLSSCWAFLNGQTISDSESPFDGITFPDASGRYLVGYGSDGGGDIGTALFSSSPVGNAGHQINLQHNHTVSGHSHTVDSHGHSIPSHTHTSPGHTHGVSGNTGLVPRGGADYDFTTGSGNGGGFDIGITNDVDSGDHRHPISLTSASTAVTINSGGSGTTGSASPGTSSVGLTSNNSLSTTQSIQPRSIQVRWIVRIK